MKVEDLKQPFILLAIVGNFFGIFPCFLTIKKNKEFAMKYLLQNWPKNKSVGYIQPNFPSP
jgi:hypothetical protein